MSNEDAHREFERRLFGELDDSPNATGWGAAELEVAWTHVLQLRIRELFNDGTSRSNVDIRVHELVYSAEPPALDELRRLKKWAQTIMRGAPQSVSEIPPQVASALYHLLVVLALTCHRVSIAELDDRALDQGVRWASRQQWVDSSAKRIMSKWPARCQT